MSDIQELRMRVEATAQAFGAVGDQQEAHRQRLIDVMHAVDAALRRKQEEVLELRDENTQLRQLLETLPTAAEASSDDRVGAVIADLDVAVAAFGGAASAPAAAEPMPETPALQLPEDDLDPARLADALGDGAADLIDELNGEIETPQQSLPVEPAPAVPESAVPDGGEPALPLDDDPVAELAALLDGEEAEAAEIDPVAIAEEAVRTATEAIEADDDEPAPAPEPAASPEPAADGGEPTVREIMERADKLSRELNADGATAETG